MAAGGKPDGENLFGVTSVLYAFFADVFHGGGDFQKGSRKARRGNGIAHDNGVHADGIEAHGDGLGFTVGCKGVRAARADDDGGTLFDGNLF